MYTNVMNPTTSPVVATVILFAVAVVIAMALAGFSSSVFGTYSSSNSIAVKTMTVDVNGDGLIELVNRGALSDSVASIHVPGQFSDGTARPALLPGPAFADIYLMGADCATPATPPDPAIAANSEGTICFVGLDPDPVPAEVGFVAGQQITVKIKMTSGVELTQSVTVQPA